MPTSGGKQCPMRQCGRCWKPDEQCDAHREARYRQGRPRPAPCTGRARCCIQLDRAQCRRARCANHAAVCCIAACFLVWVVAPLEAAPDAPTVVPIGHLKVRIQWTTSSAYNQYNLRITDNNYFAFDSNFVPITERDLTLEDVSGTSYDVGPDNLATFTVSAGTALTSFVAGLTPKYLAKIVGVTPTQSTEVSQGTLFNPLERPATPQNLGICAASDTNAPCDTYQHQTDALLVYFDRIDWVLDVSVEPAEGFYYTIEISTAETFNTVTESKTFQRSEEPSGAADKIEVPFTGLDGGVIYFARVTAYRYFQGYWTEPSSGYTVTSPPSAPSLSNAEAKTFRGVSSIQVTIGQPSDTGQGDTSVSITGYDVQVSASSTFADPCQTNCVTKVLTDANQVSQASFILVLYQADVSFLDDTSGGYYLRVAASNSLATGPYSSVVFTGAFVQPDACAAGFYLFGETQGQEECRQCPTYSNSPAASEALTDCKCNMGYTGPDGDTCEVCAAGKYKNTVGDATCTTCPGGNALAGSTSSSACQCAAGSAGVITDAGGTCTTCQAGTYSAAAGSSECQDCVAGKYNTAPASTSCSLCPTNSVSQDRSDERADCKCNKGYSGPDGGTCTPCEAGTYTDAIGATECSNCGIGNYAIGTANTVCGTCPADSTTATETSSACLCNAGYAGPAGGTCSACPAGKIANVQGLTACVDCIAGKYVSSTAATVCVFCGAAGAFSSPPGSTSQSNCKCNAGYEGSTCSACVAGKFKNVEGPNPCTDCLADTYADGTASTVCTDCPANTVTSGGTATTALEACQCDSGYTGPDGGSCEACDAGTFKGVVGSDACENCEAGKYSSSTAQAICASCPTGATTDGDAKSSANECLCNSGYTGTSTCVACQAGKYKGSLGPAACDQCLVDTFSAAAATVCTDCELGANAPAGSTAATACKCNAGFTGPNGDTCSACVAGKFKNVEGPDPCTDCLADTYADGTASTVCTDCPANTVTSGGTATTALEACQCDSGYTGPDGGSCGACDEGTFKGVVGSDACENCEAGKYSSSTAQAICASCPTGATSPEASTSSGACLCLEGYTEGNGQCVACQAGKYKSVQGVQACVNCDAGSFSAAGASSCTLCPADSTSPEASTSVSACRCVPGYQGGNTNCVQCVAGKFKSTVGSNSCSSCAAGSYSDDTGFTACVDCPAGSSTSDVQSTSLADCRCEAGYTGPDGAECTACGAGTFKSETGVAGCTNCEAGKFTTDSGSTVCISCPAGAQTTGEGATGESACLCDVGYTELGNNRCDPCPAGEFKASLGVQDCDTCSEATYSAAGASTCTSCASNTFSPAGSTSISKCICEVGYTGNGIVCTECPSGKFKSLRGSSSCIACPAGKYQRFPASNVCENCPDHSHSPTTSSEAEACRCNQGYSGYDGSFCSPCQPGTYKSVAGSEPLTCTSCEEGKYSSTEASLTCSSCPSRSSSPEGNDDVANCLCIEGYVNSGSSCQACPAGKFKSSKSNDDPCEICGAGTYSSSGSQECISCPDGKTTSNDGSDSLSDCGCFQGYTGSNCDACPPGKYKPLVGGAACSNCPSGKYTDYSGAMLCNLCDPNADSPAGSNEFTDCKCNRGYEGPDGSICYPCASGKYKSGTGYGDCISCEPGKFGTDSAASSCTWCPSGATSSEGSDSLSACSCAPGYFADYVSSGGACKTCPAGKFKADEGNQGCDDCAEGTFSAQAASTCSFCPDYSTSPARSSSGTSCLCNVGYSGSISSSGSGACASCNPGKYKGNAGTSSCVSCPGNTYSDNAAASTCSDCVVDSSSPSSSDDRMDCRCNAGYSGDGYGCFICGMDSYAPAGSTSCTSCPIFTTSPEGSDTVTDCKCSPGYTGTILNSAGTCTACDLGKYKVSTGGSLCTSCPRGKYQQDTAASSCMECEDNANTAQTGSESWQDCVCNAGYTGAFWCTACSAGNIKPTTGPDDCTACVAGKYIEIEAATTCKNCPTFSSSPIGSSSSEQCLCAAGYQGGSASSCSACPQGKYKTDIGTSCDEQCAAGKYGSASGGASESAACTNCQPGKASPDRGVTSCVTCEAGKYASAGSAECTLCPQFSTSPAGSDAIGDCSCAIGYYLSSSSQSCEPCQPGTYTSSTGRTVCQSCTAGKSGSSQAATSSSDCVTCEAGTFSAAGAGSCESCPFDSTSPSGSTAQTSCKCNAGYYGDITADSGFCASCPLYSTSPAGSDDIGDCSCAKGYYLSSPQSCVACQPGTYTSSTGRTVCQSCTAGKYSSSQAASHCLLCQAGKYSEDIAATSEAVCISCPEFSSGSPAGSSSFSACVCDSGSYGTPGVCQPCAIGKYQEGRGMSACVACPMSSLNQNTGSKFRTDCQCIPGFTGPDGSGCEPCSVGKYKSAPGAQSCSACPENKITGQSEGREYNTLYASVSEDACKCKVGYYGPVGLETCTRCPEGSISSFDSSTIDACVCDQGYTGSGAAACSECQEGTYKAVTGSDNCTSCPVDHYSPSASITPTACYHAPKIEFSMSVTGNIRASDVSDAVRDTIRESVAELLGIDASLVIITSVYDARRRLLALVFTFQIIAPDEAAAQSFAERRLEVASAAKSGAEQAGVDVGEVGEITALVVLPPPPPSPPPTPTASTEPDFLTTDSILKLILVLPLADSEFTAEKRTAFRQALANAAGVELVKVRIAQVVPASASRRLLLSQSTSVTSEIAAKDSSAAAAIKASLSLDKVNAQLENAGLPQATFYDISLQGEDETPAPPPVESQGSSPVGLIGGIAGGVVGVALLGGFAYYASQQNAKVDAATRAQNNGTPHLGSPKKNGQLVFPDQEPPPLDSGGGGSTVRNIQLGATRAETKSLPRVSSTSCNGCKKPMMESWKSCPTCGLKRGAESKDSRSAPGPVVIGSKPLGWIV